MHATDYIMSLNLLWDGGVKLCGWVWRSHTRYPLFISCLCQTTRVCSQKKKRMNSLDRKCLDAFTNSKRKESLRLLQQIEHPNRLKNTVDRTLLHFAAQHGWLDIVELLVTKYSCDVDSKDAYSKTPVFLATLNGRLDVVKYLATSCKCDLTIADDNGETPLSEARRHKYKDLVKFLTGELDSNSKPCK